MAVGVVTAGYVRARVGPLWVVAEGPVGKLNANGHIPSKLSCHGPACANVAAALKSAALIKTNPTEWGMNSRSAAAFLPPLLLAGIKVSVFVRANLFCRSSPFRRWTNFDAPIATIPAAAMNRRRRVPEQTRDAPI